MRSKILLINLFLAIGLMSCVKDPKPDSQTVRILKEKERITLGVDSVTIRGEYDYQGSINGMKLRVSKEEHLHGADDYPVTLSGKAYTVHVGGLEAGTKYYYCYLVDYGSLNDYVSETYSFTTLSEKPQVQTVEVMMIDSLVVRVKCEVTDDGGAEVTERGACWNDYGDPTIDDSKTAHPEGGLGEYTCRIEGLQQQSRYFVRAYAKNANGTSYGEVVVVSTGTEVNLPTVVTIEVTGVSTTSASCLCNVVSDGGAEVTERGVCWRLSGSPFVNYSYSEGGGLGDYAIGLTELSPGTTYCVQAFAKNSKGYNYGEELTFTTLVKPETPTACIDGLFTVAEGKQVWFSQGNLIYRASNHRLDMAEEQYEYVGSGNSNISATYNDWIDLFGWGTSGYDHGAVCYQPWHNLPDAEMYFAYGSQDYALYDQTGEADWGYGVAFEDGDELTHPWRTLSEEEWKYVLHWRSTPSGIRFAKARVNGVNGVVLLPDEWNTGIYVFNNVNQATAPYTSNVLPLTVFRPLGRKGVVFLPAAGRRSNEVDVYYAGSEGFYWSATPAGRKYAVALYITSDNLDADITMNRALGLSVRLVRDVVRH